jgi:IMP and pyridine-specific 5'-nucleotidase
MHDWSYHLTAGRRCIPPSFNDIRHILNTAQVKAIASSLGLITFDGDMTLYADGADFSKDSKLVDLIVSILAHNVKVAIVTAAGYGEEAERYEKRLSGLLEGFKASKLSKEQLETFYVLGGECNYLFRYSQATSSLVYIQPEVYQPSSFSSWANDAQRINEFLDVAEKQIKESAARMSLTSSIKIIRKSKAVGLIVLTINPAN